MHAHVNCYFVCHREAFAAHGALERPLSCVGEPVGTHGAHLRESLPTVWADVWLLARVNPGVTPQSSRCGETLRAMGTLVGPLPRVSAHVLLQIVAVSEAAAADQAALRPVVIVAQLMIGQAFLGQETLATFLTLVGLFVVDSLVVLQLTDSREGLVTVSAPETMVGAVGELMFAHLMVLQQMGHLERLSTVRALVFGQQLHTLVSDALVQRPELTTALGADVGGVFTLSLPVPGQVSLGAESFPALRAFVRLHRRVEPLVFKKLKAILEAPPTQRTVMGDSPAEVDRFDRQFPGGQRC